MRTNTSISKLLGRETSLFNKDLEDLNHILIERVQASSFLILGGAGSIGQAVVKEIFARNPKKLHVVDISENNLVELVRDIRSSLGYIEGEFKTFVLDIGSEEYDAFIEYGESYDYVLNLSALKHVRSEKDPYTLMRLINVNIFNTAKTLQQSITKGVKKYFAVSTDKASNPINMMGASKRIMELYVMRASQDIEVSMARFANVAFSDGSLLYGFEKRLQKQQPLVAPADVRRYFITAKEAGELCLLATLFGANRDIFFPKLNENGHLLSLEEITKKYLIHLGYEPFICQDEAEARHKAKYLPQQGKWPCLFTDSNTTGEKEKEDFFSENDIIDVNRFQSIGIITNHLETDNTKIQWFELQLNKLKKQGHWKKNDLIELFSQVLPNFIHAEKNKFLDDKM